MRARLTLWHTAVLAIPLALFAAEAYAFVLHSSRARTDAALGEAVDDLVGELAAQRRIKRRRAARPPRCYPSCASEPSRSSCTMAQGVSSRSSIPRPPRRAASEEVGPPFDAEQLGRIVKLGRNHAAEIRVDRRSGRRLPRGARASPQCPTARSSPRRRSRCTMKRKHWPTRAAQCSSRSR